LPPAPCYMTPVRSLLALALLSSLASAEERTVDERPWFIRAEGGIGAPIGFYGAVLGVTVRPSVAVEVGGGLGITGVQIAALGRLYCPIGDSDTHSWTLAAGPSVALLSKAFGLNVVHRDDVAVGANDVYYMAMMNVEAGYEYRGHWGGLVRVAIGGYLNFAENISGLCVKDPGSTDEPPGCEPGPHLPTAPQIARYRVLPYFVFGYGFAW